MFGAIAGDVIGSVYEWHNTKSTRFPLFGPGTRFTDDTVLTVAVADSILTDTPYVENLKQYYHLYPNAGYGGRFGMWARSRSSEPYNSWGNGSAMRVSPVGFAFDTVEEVLREAKASAEVTHNHPEGIKGAQATAAAVFLARTGSAKEEIRDYVRETFGYPLDTPLDVIRPGYVFDVSCQGSVPVAITAFLESEGWEDAVRKAISVGGDSDTLACITGGIAQAFYGGVPAEIGKRVLEQYLEEPLLSVILQFGETYSCL
jgi:ADP-ribosylglycohydrolase